MEARNDGDHGRAHVHESHETLGDEEGLTQVAFIGPRASRNAIRTSSSLTYRYYEGQHSRNCSRRQPPTAVKDLKRRVQRNEG